MSLLTYIVPVVAVLAVATVYDKTSDSSGQMQLCQHQYALCTSALCVPSPDDATKAICFCDVEEGASMSTVPCDAIKPSKDSYGIATVYSTFSLKQFTQGKKGMKCPEGTPWTWCLNKRCTVDPTNPKKAVCTCDIKRTGEWTTLGGDCNTTTCKNGYWSGATITDADGGNAFLTKMLKLDKSPMTWCEATSK